MVMMMVGNTLTKSKTDRFFAAIGMWGKLDEMNIMLGSLALYFTPNTKTQSARTILKQPYL